MTALHFNTRRTFWLSRAFGGAVMASAGVAMLRAGGLGTAVGWIGLAAIVFFGVGTVVGLVQGLRRGPRLTLDARGVHDRSLGVGVIAWEDIRGVAPYRVARQPFVALYLHEPAKYLARASLVKRLLARLNAGSGLPPFSVNLAGVDADPMQVAELIAAECIPYETAHVG